MPHTVDSIKAEVVARYLIATSEEMSATLMRTAFSPNIKERADCSTAIFDAQGQVIALAQRVPVHLGSMVGAIDAIRERYGVDEIRPGDMFAANDPYNGGGSHLPDINVVAPVFLGGSIVAYVANIAHHADVGGMVPGSEAAVCKTIFQEGLRIPPNCRPRLPTSSCRVTACCRSAPQEVAVLARSSGVRHNISNAM
jgi:N-methylhydantoinase B